ncbi:MAG: Y-family DNA polymerase [Bacteroidaceae bacterium]|nr:Y-family DNA polymerase [Bacteroidaceae bacterium]
MPEDKTISNSSEWIFHIDCNSFFVSCERIFRPALWHVPTVVTSNMENLGGIIVSLSKEAKQIGLKRGDPLFQVKGLIEKNRVAVFTANFDLYHDISQRIMCVIRESGIVYFVEQYSIDEMFGRIQADSVEDVINKARTVCQMITKATDVPVSSGCAKTFTLAKVGTWFVKHYAYKDVCAITPENRERALSLLPIADVWGIGRKYRRLMEAKHIRTALEFTHLQSGWVRNNMTVIGLRTFRELLGQPCVDISELSQNKSVSTTRTFSRMLKTKDELREAISNFASSCTRKLRSQHSVCCGVSVFIMSNPHREDQMAYGNSNTATFSVPTNDTMEIVRAAFAILDMIFCDGILYKRAGVTLINILSDDAVQQDLFDKKDRVKSKQLMKTLDKINSKFGEGTVRMVVQGLDETNWHVRSDKSARCFTTNIHDIVEVHCTPCTKKRIDK